MCCVERVPSLTGVQFQLRGGCRLPSIHVHVASITVGMTTAVQVYKVKELQWTQTTQIQPQSHPYDRFLWDPVKQQHTVEVFIEDLRSR